MNSRYEESYLQNPHVFGSYNLFNNNNNFHSRLNPPPILNNNYLPINTVQKSHAQIYPSQPPTVPTLSNSSEVSYARNIKHRLFDVDKDEEFRRETEKINYRKELERQMRLDKERKAKEKKDLDDYQAERERKFNLQVQAIKAQQPDKKEQPSYFVLRSSKAQRSKNLVNSRVNQKHSKGKGNQSQQLPQDKIPKIMKRGGYHNKSSLDQQLSQPHSQSKLNSQAQNPQYSPFTQSHSHIKPKSLSDFQLYQAEIVRQRNHEQQRISSIIKMQQKMMRKLDIFKDQIIKTNKSLDLDKQVQHIRNILKSKPLKLDVFNFKESNELFENNADFFHLPKVDYRGMSNGRNRGQRSRIDPGINLNSRERQNSAQSNRNQQQNFNRVNRLKSQQALRQSLDNNHNPQVGEVRRKRQIRLFDRSRQNGKNIVSEEVENDNNSMLMPIVNQNSVLENQESNE